VPFAAHVLHEVVAAERDEKQAKFGDAFDGAIDFATALFRRCFEDVDDLLVWGYKEAKSEETNRVHPETGVTAGKT